MGDTSIVYAPFGFDTFRREIALVLGEAFWDELSRGLTLPDVAAENGCGCENMKAFMRRFERMAGAQAVKAVLYRVRHGLRPAQSAWAREELLKIGDLDVFLKNHLEREKEKFIALNREKKDFYGQEITDEALAFVLEHPAMLSPERRGDKLYITAFPSNIKAYLAAEDEREKRYQACHCPLAKASILSDSPVSKALCACSLGHVANFVEGALNRALTGRVIGSVLGGSLLCEYEIDLPKDVMEQFVAEGAL